MVSQSRSPITSVTGRSHSIDTPKSPTSDARHPLRRTGLERLIEAVELAQRLRLLHRDRGCRMAEVCAI